MKQVAPHTYLDMLDETVAAEAAHQHVTVQQQQQPPPPLPPPLPDINVGFPPTPDQLLNHPQISAEGRYSEYKIDAGLSSPPGSSTRSRQGMPQPLQLPVGLPPTAEELDDNPNIDSDGRLVAGSQARQQQQQQQQHGLGSRLFGKR
jgi:hypothetical protein